MEAIYPLSPMQKGMLFHTIYAPESGVYFQQLKCTLAGGLEVAALNRAWQQMLERHTVLRTGFIWEGQPRPLQVVRRRARLPWKEQDWRGLRATEQDRRLEAYLKEDRAQGFKLSHPPLMRCMLARRSEDVYDFVWSYHHILLDGWSIGLLLKEVFACYEAFRRGQTPDLPQPGPYQDYIAWLKKQDLASAETFWRRSLEGFSEAASPGAQRTQTSATDAVSSHDELQVQLSADVSNALQAVARQHQLTMNTIVQGAWGLLLSHYSNSTDVIFGAIVSGRPESLRGIESMVGLFVNTLPVRIRVRDEETLLEWLKTLQREQVESRRFAYSPLLDVQGWSDVPRGMPLFECIFGFENYPVERLAGEQESSLQIGDVRFIEETNYLLNLMVWESPCVLLKIFYDASRFDAAVITRMMSNLQALLERFATHLGERVSNLPLLSEGERTRLLSDLNRTEREYPPDVSIQSLFEAQARITPDATALMSGSEQLSFSELNERANRLAHHLRSLGVGPEALVGICIERSINMVVGLLGILKAGGAYLPLDPAYPQARLSLMLEDSAVKVLLVQHHLLERLGEHGARVVCIDTEWDAISRRSADNCRSDVNAENLAYIIYTSGSTGTPKGVMSVHRASLNRFRWMWEAFPFDAGEVCCQKTSLSFVDSVWEIFGPLLQGVPLSIIAEDDARDAHRLVESLAATNVSRIVLVPSLLRAVLESGQPLQSKLKSLKYCVSSGEALPTELSERFLDQLPQSKLINLYGSSEVSADVSWHEASRDERERAIPMGVPISNTQFYILNERLQPVPLGVAGHLHVGGAGLARGYLKQSAQTAERFIPDPFSRNAGARLYRTGDLVRYMDDGQIEFLGRIDQQVKIRGFRIELGEIEAALNTHPSVSECVVLARADAQGDNRLLAYLVADDRHAINATELRLFLQQTLPEYMLPSAFVMLDQMPLTPNGKVDRRALPAPDEVAQPDAQQYVGPRTLIEEMVAGIWAEVLGLKRVSVEANFFELGGHSLLAMQVVSRVREACGVEVAVRKLFERGTVAGLAVEVEQELRGGANEAVEAIERVRRDEEMPLSFAQQRLWLAGQMEGFSPLYNVPARIRLSGELNTEALEQSLNEIVKRHEVLRTNFVTVDGRPVQVIKGAMPSAMSKVDLSHLAQGEREVEMLRTARLEASRAFDLTKDSLLRVTLLRLSEEEHVVLLTMHHIVSDGWSLGVLVREVAALYEAFSGERPSPLAELKIQYADFAVWQRESLEGERGARLLSYWKRQLAGAPEALLLPTDRPRPAAQSFRGAVSSFLLSTELNESLKAVGAQEGATLFMTLLAAFKALLSLSTGQDSIVVGTDIAGRNRGELEKLIGFFVNQLVLLTNLDGNPSFRELLRRVRDVCLGAYTHQDLPFDKLVEELNPKRDMSRAVLFQVKMILQNAPMPPLELPRLSLTPLEIEPETAKYDLLLDMGETELGLKGAMHYSTDLFDAQTIERLLRHYESILRYVAERPDARLSDVAKQLAATDQQQRAIKEKEYEETRRSKLKNVKRKVIA
jgi:amino acid adenylation domain-containing protein